MKIANLYADDGSAAEGADWVHDGEGQATLLLDAEQLLYTGTEWMARAEVGPGETSPEGFVVGQETVDGGAVGWVPTDGPALDFPTPGVWLREADGRMTRIEDVEVLPERGARNVKRLLRRAVERGAVGVVFRHPTGPAYKVRASD